MNLIDRYIFLEWLKSFVMTLAVTFGILVIWDMYDNMQDLIEFGAGMDGIVRYYAILLPTMLPGTIPVALLISLLHSLGTLHRSNEITAMRAAGLSLFRITRTLWAGGLALSVLVLFLNAVWAPRAMEQARMLWEHYAYRDQLQTADADVVGAIPNLKFFNQTDGRLWFTNRFNDLTYRAYGVTVSVFDEDRNETRRIMANEAYFDDFEGHWVFLDGRDLLFSTQSGQVVHMGRFARLAPEAFTETPNLMKALEKRPKDLSFLELSEVLLKVDPKENPRVRAYAVRFHDALASPFTCLILIGLAVPFAVSGVRVNPMVGVSKSMGLFATYYLTATIFHILGEQSLLSPATAAWLPNFVMAGVAVGLLRRAE